MARTETVITVFLASPGDVLEERNRLEDALSDWNQTWARNLGVRLELLRWEHDAYPDVGVDAQDVINRQIPHDYDLFVGIMWSRFGTPTGRAGSGTTEEFERALERFKSSSNDVSILFYFKDAPVPPSKIDPGQLMKVQDFKNSLQEIGVLYWSFVDTDQFEKLVALHITRHVQNWKQKNAYNSIEVIIQPPVIKLIADVKSALTTTGSGCISSSSSDDEDGYLDLLEIFSERNSELTDIANRLSESQNELTLRTAQGTAELQTLLNAPQEASSSQIRRVISKISDEMLRFTDRMNAEIPLFRSAIDGSINALTRAATLSVDFNMQHLHETKTAAITLRDALSGARSSMSGFRDSTLALPRMTKEINTAKRKQAKTLDEFIAELANAESLLGEAVTVVDTLLQDAE